MNSVMSVQQKNKMADGPRFVPHYDEAPFIIIEERVGHFKEKNLANRLTPKNNILA